jgi:hypothetical protein
MAVVRFSAAAEGGATGRIVLESEADAMQVRVWVPALGNQVFALGGDLLVQVKSPPTGIDHEQSRQGKVRSGAAARARRSVEDSRSKNCAESPAISELAGMRVDKMAKRLDGAGPCRLRRWAGRWRLVRP